MHMKCIIHLMTVAVVVGYGSALKPTVRPPAVPPALPSVRKKLPLLMLTSDQLAEFESTGFLVLPKVVPDRDVRRLRRNLYSTARGACAECHADHESVKPPADAAAFQYEKDVHGNVKRPLRVHKIQGVALVCDDVKALLQMNHLSGAARELAKSQQIDAFGTKYFPVAAGSVGSVGWHDDNYYFGTSRSRTISCVVYLRDTHRLNGCLRVVPGSHLSKRVGPERGDMYINMPERIGEYIPEEVLLASVSTPPLDVGVPAGSAVLFDANLLHAAWPNAGGSSLSERVAFHYIPLEVESEFRGVSFARGAFADRHEATLPSPPAKRAKLV